MKRAPHIKESARQWRIRKRREWRAVMSTLNVFSNGCAYTPVYIEFCKLESAARKIHDDLSPAR
jgi:hypothetical protein